MVFLIFLHHIFYFIFISSLNCSSHPSNICIVSLEDFLPSQIFIFLFLFFPLYMFPEWPQGGIIFTGNISHHQPCVLFIFLLHSLWREEGELAAVTFFVSDSSFKLASSFACNGNFCLQWFTFMWVSTWIWESKDTHSTFKIGQAFVLRYIFATALNELN